MCALKGPTDRDEALRMSRRPAASAGVQTHCEEDTVSYAGSEHVCMEEQNLPGRRGGEIKRSSIKVYKNDDKQQQIHIAAAVQAYRKKHRFSCFLIQWEISIIMRFKILTFEQ